MNWYTLDDMQKFAEETCWKVIERLPHNRHWQDRWLCLCSKCGKIKPVLGAEIRRKKSTACCSKYRHSLSNTREYRIWRNIKSRCFNKRLPDYPDYGGRGITLCDLWKNDFRKFYNHIGPCPTPQHSLDRIDNNGNYEPGNVRWATASEQRFNQRCRRIELFSDGEIITELVKRGYSVSGKHS